MAYLYDIGISSGESVAIGDTLKVNREKFSETALKWVQDPLREKAVRSLAADGFSSFVVSADRTAQLARAAISATLQTSGAGPGELDAVMISTESFWEEDETPSMEHVQWYLRQRHSLLRVMADLGLSRAVPYGNWMAGCANFGTALGLARALVTGRQHRQMLLAFVDKLPPWEPRLMESGAAVVSDLATSCILGRERRGFELKAVVSVAAPAVASFNWTVNSPKEIVSVMLDTRRALLRLRQDFADVTGRSLSSFDTIAAGHFHPYTLKVICDALKLSAESLFRDGRARFGHAFASDSLLTLSALEAGGTLEDGQDVVLLNSAIWCWNLIWVTKVSS